MSTPARSPFLAAVDLARIGLGWGAFFALTLAAGLLRSPLPAVGLTLLWAAVVATIIGCAFGVVKQAEALAHRLGDPYGSLVLTLSVVLIEIVLIAAVMLGPGEHAVIARDSVLAVSMIILNLVIGLSLLVGGLRHGSLSYNRTGASAYLAMLIVLSVLAFGLPAVIGSEGAYPAGQQIPVIVVAVALYAFFLHRQLGAQAGDFRDDAGQTSAGAAPDIRETITRHRREVLIRTLLLIATMSPIVLLSHHLATLTDDGLGRWGAPDALAGVLIAMIVFLPESLTSVRAALAGQAQRVSNLCHGALVSTVGLTIPVVLLIGLLTGQRAVLAESPANLLLLGTTLLLSVATFTSRRLTALHGAAHLAAFVLYGLVLFG